MYEKPKKKLLPSIRVDEMLDKAVRREAKRHKVSVSDVVREALKSHLGMNR